jgi:alpha-glucoside transport system permease protein
LPSGTPISLFKRGGKEPCIRHFRALITIIVGVGGCVGYFYFSNQFLDKVLFPATGENAGRNINARQPWSGPGCSCFPRLFALGLYLAYPVFETLRLSLTDRDAGGAFVGLANYNQMFSEPKFWEALTNNMLWLFVVPAARRPSGCLAAQADRPPRLGQYRQIADLHADGDLLRRRGGDLPKLIYDARPEEQAQIGVLNAVWLQLSTAASGCLAVAQGRSACILICWFRRCSGIRASISC